MLDKLNTCIFDFSHESEPGDYWYDCAILEAIEILKQFSQKDWDLLLKQLNFQSLFWKKRLVECLGDLQNQYELKVILSIICTENEDLFITCIDALRGLDLSCLNSEKKQLLQRTQAILKATISLSSKRILTEFLYKTLK
ncbi:hypothetical protein [Commensalibacter intestini]|uniref:hypothetical protein n=1 Tax=Commensalibacter intestini TaxID=479936 RepID=UPI000A363F7F|nr:hypothetical protein [Commensalibacter intestini]